MTRWDEGVCNLQTVLQELDSSVSPVTYSRCSNQCPAPIFISKVREACGWVISLKPARVYALTIRFGQVHRTFEEPQEGICLDWSVSSTLVS